MRRVIIPLVMVLAACGGAASSGDGPVDGEELFEASVLAGQAGCITCHSLTPDKVLVGPSLAGLGSRAGSTVPGLSAEEYLRQSILDPDAYVVEGFEPGRMLSNWGEVLSEEEVDALVAYLEGLS